MLCICYAHQLCSGESLGRAQKAERGMVGCQAVRYGILCIRILFYLPFTIYFHSIYYHTIT